MGLVVGMLLLLLVQTAAAQEQGTKESRLPERVDTLRVVGPGPFLLRPFLALPLQDLRIHGVQVRPEEVQIDPADGLLTFIRVAPDSQLVVVARYRHVPLSVARVWQAWPQAADSVRSEGRVPPTGVAQQRLETRGSITRGVSAGTGRDARVESGLRLQVAGNLTPGIRLDASLTDEDTPLVPEGVTRQLDQFDRIRIGVEGRAGRVELGDFDARLDGTLFGRLHRRLQGAGVTSKPLSMRSGPVQVTAGAAISRGIFRSMPLSVIDGVQGPYRLTGDAGERFILVIPGTERVYLDGQQLEAGPEGDYVLDHATAELTFTARQIMRAGQRVTVEFEYTTQRFSRTLAFAQATGTWQSASGRPLLAWGVSSIREADGDAFVDELGLSAADSLAVASSSGGTVRVDGATEVLYDPLAPFTQYFRVEGPDGRVVYEEVGRTPLEGEPVYRVIFSFSGQGEGDYERVAGLSGNVAYRYRGEGQGAYAPERTLPVPVAKTLSAVNLRTTRLPFVEVGADWGFAALDRNRLSAAPAATEGAHAWGVSASSKGVAIGGGWVWSVDGRLAGREAAFETFERSRDVDFLRQWNLPLTSLNANGALIEGQNERQGRVRSRWAGPDSTGIDASWQRLTLGAAIEAERFDGRIRLMPRPGWRVRASAAQVRTEGVVPDEFASRRRILGARLVWQPEQARWSRWVEWERERYRGADPKGSGSLALERRIPVDAFRVGADGSFGAWTIGVQAEERREQVRPENAFEAWDYRTVQGQLGWQPSRRWRTSLVGGWRGRSPAASLPDAASSAKNVDRTLLLTWLGQGGTASGHRFRWNYDVRAEQTATQQEIYLRTGPERGSYVWVDANGDRVIQEDEFLPESLPGEGEYARVLFPSDSLESVTTASLGLGYEHVPQRTTPSWMRFSLKSNVEVSETSRDPDRAAVALLRPGATRVEGQTVNGRFRVSQQVGLTPLDPDRDVDVSLVRVRALAALATGSQKNRLDEATLRWREALSRRWDVTGEVRSAVDGSTSSRYASRTYDITRTAWQPGLVFKPGRWRLHGRWVRSTASESVTASRVSSNRIPLEALLAGSRYSWRGGAEWARTRVRGGQAVGLQLFELTEGRGAGTSWMWNLRLEARITEVVTASLHYDGRQPEGSRTLHTGSFQLSARF
jgi:hypothetical protein